MGRLIYHRLDKHLPTVIEIELLDSVLQYLVCFRITRARGVHMHLPLLEVELRQSFILPTGKLLCILLRIPLHERGIGPDIPIQYCTTDPLVKTAMVPIVPHRVSLTIPQHHCQLGAHKWCTCS